MKCAPFQNLPLSCSHAGKKKSENTASSTCLGFDGSKHSQTVIEEARFTCSPARSIWIFCPRRSCLFIGPFIYLFIYLFIRPAAAAFVRPSATQACTLVNGQHPIGVMERLRDHAHTGYTLSSCVTCVKQHACYSVIHPQRSATTTRPVRAGNIFFFCFSTKMVSSQMQKFYSLSWALREMCSD